MSQGIVSAYLDKGMKIPPIGGGEYATGFLRQAVENDLEYGAWQYPNAMVVLCMDAAVNILRGRLVPRFIDFVDHIPGTGTFSDSRGKNITIRIGVMMYLVQSSFRMKDSKNWVI